MGVGVGVGVRRKLGCSRSPTLGAMQSANATPRSRGCVKSFEVESGDRTAAGSGRRGGEEELSRGHKNGRGGRGGGGEEERPTRGGKDVEKGKERPCTSTGSRLTHPTIASNLNSLAKPSIFTSLHPSCIESK
jgi:hypothetical protein